MDDSLVTPWALKVLNKDLGKYFHKGGDIVSEREGEAASEAKALS